MTKSSTCSGKKGPLAEFRSESEASDFIRYKEINHLVPYQCPKCDMWHLSPQNRQTPNTPCESCGKSLYPSEETALLRATIIENEQGISLSAYPCPLGGGWHLTSK